MAVTTERTPISRTNQMVDLMGAASIWQRELVRFFRERARAVTSFVQPLLYLLVFGTGLGAVVRGSAVGGEDYRTFLLPGVIVMTTLFSSMFGGMSVVWDREFGFLKEILVSPVSRSAIILGKSTGGATTAGMQGLAILLFSPIVGLSLSPLGVLQVIPPLIIFAITVNLLGVAIAARVQTMQAFFVVQNFIMLPLFFLSGAVFPLNTVPGWLRVGAILDPATYAVDAIRRSLIPDYPAVEIWEGQTLTVGIDIAVLAVLASLLFVSAVRGLNKQP